MPARAKMDRKSPGHEAPIPSAAQNVPRLVSRMPTAYFNVFSGTRASGLRTASPAAATTAAAVRPPVMAAVHAWPGPPTAITMNTTSSPSRNTPFRARMKPTQSRRVTASPSWLTVSWKARTSSCIATTPAERSTALCSQRKPNRSSSVPTSSFRAHSGMVVTMSCPKTSTSRPSSTIARRAPRSGSRHPRVRPTARTIVSASVVSTAEPRNAAPKMKSCWPMALAEIRGLIGLVRPGLYTDDSITRRVNRENILLLGGGRALLMQLAHPKVAAGVDEHSDFRTHPIQRLRRTVRMIMAIVFGDRDTALAAARAVNQVHSKVQGREYRALDPDLLRWVHATLIDSALVTYETFVKPLSAREREDFYQESKLLGEILGIPREQFPATHRDFNDYLAAMTSDGPVRVGPRAMDLARLVTRPRLRLVPGPTMIPFEVVTAGLLPPKLREQYRLPWGPAQQRVYRLMVIALPRLVAVTPPVPRVWRLPGHNVSLSPSLSLTP